MKRKAAILVIAVGLAGVEPQAQQIAGEIVYTDGDDYPALCEGREVDWQGVPVVARICYDCAMPKITATSCTLIFAGGFE